MKMRELALKLGVSYQTIKNFVKEGCPNRKVLGCHVRDFVWEDVIAWLEGREERKKALRKNIN